MYYYFLEYAEKANKVLDDLEWDTDVEFDYEWEQDTLIIYTDEDPDTIQDMVWEECGVYPVQDGKA